MFQKAYNKLQTREGITLVASVAIIVGVIGFLCHGFAGMHRSGFQNPNQPIPSIRVSGTGEMNVSPDIATFTYSISKDSATIADARNTVATIGNDLIKKLKDVGIAEKDIKAQNISTYPKYENRASIVKCISGMNCPEVYNSVVVGYTVSTDFSVKVRDLDQVSKIATLLTDAKLFSLNGPNFSVDDVQVVQNQAREKAIADAKEQAKVLAGQLGVHLGKIIDFQVDTNGGIAPMMYDRAALASVSAEKSIAPELPTGETKITSNVTITYTIR